MKLVFPSWKQVQKMPSMWSKPLWPWLLTSRTGTFLNELVIYIYICEILEHRFKVSRCTEKKLLLSGKETSTFLCKFPFLIISSTSTGWQVNLQRTMRGHPPCRYVDILLTRTLAAALPSLHGFSVVLEQQATPVLNYSKMCFLSCSIRNSTKFLIVTSLDSIC